MTSPADHSEVIGQNISNNSSSSNKQLSLVTDVPLYDLSRLNGDRFGKRLYQISDRTANELQSVLSSFEALECFAWKSEPLTADASE